jgi:hypothetical protein
MLTPMAVWILTLGSNAASKRMAPELSRVYVMLSSTPLQKQYGGAYDAAIPARALTGFCQFVRQRDPWA